MSGVKRSGRAEKWLSALKIHEREQDTRSNP